MHAYNEAEAEGLLLFLIKKKIVSKKDLFFLSPDSTT